MVIIKTEHMCDVRDCPALALVKTEVGDGTHLQWCSHHYAIYADRLMEMGAMVIEDQRDLLTDDVA